MDESTAIHPAQMLPPRTHVSVTPTSGLERAQVKWFNRLRGFGFLTRGEGTEDIFVHMETLRRYGFIDPKPGDTMLARFGPGPKGLLAAEVLGKSKPPRIHSIPVWGLQLVAALISVVGQVSRGSRRSAAMLRWMIYSGTHDAIAPACGALRLRDEHCAKRDALPHQVVPA